jgi:hypothetical protein
MPDGDYSNWQEAAKNGNLLTYAGSHVLNALVPGYRSDEPGYLKALDVASLPARAAVNALVGPVAVGGQAMDQWMRGHQGLPTRDLITRAVMGIFGLGVEGAKPTVGQPPEASLRPPPGYQLVPVDYDPFQSTGGTQS